MENNKEIESFIGDYEEGMVEVSPGVSYSMRDINNESHRLYNRQFESGEFEDNGFRRVFVAKMWVIFRTLVQGADLDMKNLSIRSLNGVKIKLVAILKMAFISHLGRTFFGEFIDKVMSEMCWFGSSIVKRVDGSVETVDLRNYITEPNIKNPQERRHADLVYYTYDQMLSNKESWEESWEFVGELWEQMQRERELRFKVIEFWTWGELGESKKDEKIHKICIKYLDNTLTKPDTFHDTDQWQPYVELERFVTPYRNKRTSKRMAKRLGEFEEMFPYEQFDLFTVPGRGQGMGCGELLSAPQMMTNELWNEKRKLNQKGLLGINIHTATQGVNGLSTLSQDAIANLDSGTVISLAPGETFNQLAVDMKTGDFEAMEDKIYELMRQIIGITAQGTGEEIAASTSATAASINQQNANTVFDYTRERMAHGLKRLFNNGYAEDIINELDEKELVAIIGDPTQLQELDKDLIDNAMNKWALDTKNATGMYPTEEEYMQARENVHQELMAQGDMRFPAMKKELLKEMEYYMDFDMGQEAFDYKGRFDALSAIKGDPTSTKDKGKIEDEILSLQGLNPRAYDKSKEQLVQEQQMAMQQQMEQAGQQLPPQPLMA